MDIRGFRARPIYTSAQMLEYVGKTATLCHNSGHGTVIKGWSKLLRMSHRNKRIRDQFGVFGESKKPSGTGRAKTAMGVWRDVHYELSEVSGALSFAQFERLRWSRRSAIVVFRKGWGRTGKIGTRLSTIITDLIIPKRVTGMRKLKSGLHLRTADRPQSGRGRIMGRCVRSKSGWAGGRSAADFWMV